jgi:Tol biopolymer transport system component
VHAAPRTLVILIAAGVIILTSCRPSAIEVGSDIAGQAHARTELGKVAFVRGGDLWVKPLPAGPEQQLTHTGTVSRPRWSPSGRWLAYVTTADPHQRSLWVVRGDGAAARVETTQGGDLFAWSPRADQLAYVANGGLTAWDADSGQRHVLATSTGSGPGVMDLAWSPDGRWLLYSAIARQAPAAAGTLQMPRATVARVPADGSQTATLWDGGTPSSGWMLTAGWAPDGSQVLLWSDPAFSASLLADGSGLVRLSLGRGAQGPLPLVARMLPHPDFLAWAPDGRHLALVQGQGRSTWGNKGIALASLAGAVQRLSPPTRSDLFPAWSPDGQWIAFTSAPAVRTDGGDAAKRASAMRRIWVMQPTGAAAHPITSGAAVRDEWPRWSRNGAAILFARLLGDRAQLWLMRPDGTGARPVLDDISPGPDSGISLEGFYGFVDWSQLGDWWQEPSETTP